MSGTRWTEDEVAALRQLYAVAPANEMLNLDAFAKRCGRDKTNVCRKARSLGLTNQKRPELLQTNLSDRGPRFATAAERSAAASARVKDHQAKNGHPRGMLGKRHTEETRLAMSAASKARWADPSSGLNSPEQAQRRSDQLIARIESGQMRAGYSRTRGGRRADLDGRYFRSAWEANYARFLNFLKARGEISGWEYECKTFVFEAIKRGTRAYTPDFKVTTGDRHEWHEVKGWMDQPSRTRLKRMAKYFPAEKVVVIDAGWFRQANKTLAGAIAGWETGTTR
jgi:hypothetical protein